MISIISSLFKSDRYLPKFSARLEEFAESLKGQNIDFELIAIANEPTEKEKRFAGEFAANAWFKFFSVGRESLYATWNRGVGLSRGEILGFWNVDDIRYGEAIGEALKLINQGAELVYFPFYIKRYLKIGKWHLPLPAQKIDKQVLEFNRTTRREFQRSMLCGPFFIFTRALYQRVGLFDEQFKIAGDFEWCARAAKISDKFIKAKIPAGEFRLDGGGLSAGGKLRQTIENNIIYRRVGALDKIRPENPGILGKKDF